MKKHIRILDLFCCAGGAAMGYYRAFTEAGYDVEITGVDINPQKHYPFHHIVTDAMTFPLDGYDFIHASPPCQDYSTGAAISRAKKVHPDYPRLIAPLRSRQTRTQGPWIIENVEGARSEMHHPVTLCGTSFGLRVWRHRLFESNILLFYSGACHHQAGDVSVRRKHNEYIGLTSGVIYHDKHGRTRKRPKFCPLPIAKAAMGIDWMNADELGESIPPAYTHWLGLQIAAALANTREEAA